MHTPKSKVNIGITLLIALLVTLVTGIILHLKKHGIVVEPRPLIKTIHWIAGLLLDSRLTDGNTHMCPRKTILENVCEHQATLPLVLERYVGCHCPYVGYLHHGTCKTSLTCKDTPSRHVALRTRSGNVCSHRRPSRPRHPRSQPPEKSQVAHNELHISVNGKIRNYI